MIPDVVSHSQIPRQVFVKCHTTATLKEINFLSSLVNENNYSIFNNFVERATSSFPAN